MTGMSISAPSDFAPVAPPLIDGVPLPIAKALIRHYEASNNYNVGYTPPGQTPVDLSSAPLGADGFPQWDGNQGPQGNSRAAGGYQFEPGTWGPIAQKLGITDFSPQSQDAVADVALQKRGFKDWAPFNPKLAAAIQQYKETGKMDPSIDPSEYPPFGAARTLASLMPTGDGTSSAATAGLNSGGDPTASLAGLTDILKSGGSYLNPSKLLASMAAGFLGGKGPAASLAGGFAGVAQSQKDDTAEGAQLAKLGMMYGPILQAQINAKKLANVAGLARSGTPLGTAMRMAGADLPPGETEQSMNEQSRSSMPLPATAQKVVQEGTKDVLTQRTNQIQLKTIRDQIANGDFHVDPFHRNLYAVQNMIGFPSDAASKWIAMTQTLRNMQGDLMSSQKGAQSDQRANQAYQQLVGDTGGLQSDAQAINHFDYLGNHAALAEKNMRTRIGQAFTLSKQKIPGDLFDNIDSGMPASPYSGADPNVIGKQLYGDNTTTQSATAPPGQPLAGNAVKAAPAVKAGTGGVLPSGRKWSIVPNQ